jgi:transmembrane sensor
MNDKDEQERAMVAGRAADWLVDCETGMSRDEREAFARWLKASPLHIREYMGVASVARDLRKRVAPGDFDLDELIKRAREEPDTLPFQRARERTVVVTRPAVRWFAAAAGLGVLGLLGFYAWSAWNAQRQLAHAPGPVEDASVVRLAFATRHGQQSTEKLPDGSVLRLNSDTAVTVSYSARQRSVVLAHGQADFAVIHDPRRMFTVLAGSAQITDVGTTFDVDLEHGTTVVTVVEGSVAVARAPTPAVQASPPNARPIQLSANQQLTVSAEDWSDTPKSVDAQRETAWQRGQIVFEHEPLEKVAAKYNRYASAPIEIVTPSLRELQISGVFSTDDPAAFIAFLRSLDGVRVEVTPTQILVESTAGGRRGH